VELKEQPQAHVRASLIAFAKEVLEGDCTGISEQRNGLCAAPLNLRDQCVEQLRVVRIVGSLEETDRNARRARTQLAVGGAPGLKTLPIGEHASTHAIRIIEPEIQRELRIWQFKLRNARAVECELQQGEL